MKGIYLTILLLVSFSTLGKENLTPLTPEQLFSDPEVSDFSMSPDGKYMAVVIPQENTDLVSITDLDAKKITYSFRMGKNKYMGRFRWANNTRLLIEPAIKVAFRDQKYLTQKLQAINFDGSQNRLLYGYRVDLTKSAKNKRFNDYFHIESILPNDDEHILLSTQVDWKSSSTKQLQKLNIYKGKLYPRERSSVSNANFTVDYDGNPVAQTGTSSEDEYIFEYKNKKDEWQKFPDADNYTLLSNAFDSNIYLSKMISGDNKEEILQFNRFDQSIPWLHLMGMR
ncbi:hypothetical protein [Aliikangiella sp. IMCC44359]|uniref:hypothetical protein n=1 Tax=Aliikangiella sp. IMCC44359 TaxID=3459125 RepID=UPI00403AA060